MRHLPNLICLIRLVLIWPIVVALHKNINLLALLGYVMLATAALSLPVAGRGLRGLRARRRERVW